MRPHSFINVPGTCRSATDSICLKCDYKYHIHAHLTFTQCKTIKIVIIHYDYHYSRIP